MGEEGQGAERGGIYSNGSCPWMNSLVKMAKKRSTVLPLAFYVRRTAQRNYSQPIARTLLFT